MHRAAAAHPDDGAFVSILHFEVTGQPAQDTFLDAYRPVLEQHVSDWPGFLDATLHASTDGSRVVATVRWQDETSYRHFLAESDAEARMAAITAALDAAPGTRGPSMDRLHTYRIASTVRPAAHRVDRSNRDTR